MSKRAKISKKAKAAVKSNVFASVAMVSLLLNLFLLVGIGMYNATNRLDESVYNSAYSNLCEEHFAVNRADAEAESKGSGVMLDIACVRGDFAKYHNAAVKQYLNER